MTATRNRIAFVLAALAGLALIVAGPVMLYKGFDGKSQVVSQLKQEKIVTAEDASIPNTPVTNAATAQAQADVIWKHMMEASGGKTFAELPRDSQVRPTLQSGDSLRSALLSSVLAWNIANLVIGLGAVFTGLGFVFLALAFAVRPSKVRVPANAASITSSPAGVA